MLLKQFPWLLPALRFSYYAVLLAFHAHSVHNHFNLNHSAEYTKSSSQVFNSHLNNIQIVLNTYRSVFKIHGF